MEMQGVSGPVTAVRPSTVSNGRPRGAVHPLSTRPARVHLVDTAAQGHALAAALRTAAPAVELSGPSDAAGAAEADAVLVVCDAGQELTGAELDRLRSLPLDRPVILAMVKIDLYPRWRHVLTADVERLRALGVVAEPFPLPSLPAWLAAERTPPAVNALAARVRTIAAPIGPPGQGTAGRPPDSRIPHSSTPTGRRGPAGDGLDADDVPAPESAAPSRSPLRSPKRPRRGPRPARDRRSWSHLLGDGSAAAASDVEFDLRTRVRAVLAEAERAIDAGDPAVNWEGFATWLRTRLTFEAGQTRALLQERTTALAGALTAHLGLSERDALRPPALPALPELFEHLPERGDPTGSSRPLATRSRAVLVAAYGGIMMTVVLPRLAGLAVSAWVLAGMALVAAVTLSAATLAGERKRQLDRRRSHAKSLVRHCIDGFLLGAGKFTRDGLRTAQQQLRDACADRDEDYPRG